MQKKIQNSLWIINYDFFLQVLIMIFPTLPLHFVLITTSGTVYAADDTTFYTTSTRIIFLHLYYTINLGLENPGAIRRKTNYKGCKYRQKVHFCLIEILISLS